MILEPIVGGILVRIFGTQIDNAGLTAKSYLRKWFSKLNSTQLHNVESLTSASSKLQSTNFLDLPPSSLIMILEWVEEVKDVPADSAQEIRNIYSNCLDGILQGNYDLMNAIRKIDISCLEDLNSGSPIMPKTAKFLSDRGLGTISKPHPKSKGLNEFQRAAIYFGPGLLIALLLSTLFLLLWSTPWNIYLGILWTICSAIIVIAPALKIMSVETQVKNPKKFLHRCLLGEKRTFHINTNGKYILYNLFPKTFTSISDDEQYIIGERQLEIHP